ncbi:MAG: hypothetical protein ACI8Q1_002000 [Parvicella sp.]|jgi:hypothetical protein
MRIFKCHVILIGLTFLTVGVSAQNIGISSAGVPADASSLLDINASPGNDKGLLIPRIALTSSSSALPITTPAVSLLVYNTAVSGVYPNNVTPGYYYWSGSSWIAFETQETNYHSIDANAAAITTSTTCILLSGMTLTPGEGKFAVSFNGQCDIPEAEHTTGVSTSDLTTDLYLIYNDIKNLTVTNTVHPLAFGSGEVLSPGVYDLSGALTLAGSLILDGGGTSDPFIIIGTGAFNVTAGATVTMINGASSNNVIWLAEAVIGVGANTTIPGILFSNSAAIAVGDNCNISGRMFTKSGAVSFGAGTLSLPPTPSYINLRGLDSFIMFTGTGAATNSGASTYTGNIGTNGGAITSFDVVGCTVYGTLFPAGSTTVVTPVFHVATFALYQNGVLISNTERTFVYSSVIYLQGTASVGVGQAIEVRWNTDTQVSDTGGQVNMSNRILSVTRVR